MSVIDNEPTQSQLEKEMSEVNKITDERMQEALANIKINLDTAFDTIKDISDDEFRRTFSDAFMVMKGRINKTIEQLNVLFGEHQKAIVELKNFIEGHAKILSVLCRHLPEDVLKEVADVYDPDGSIRMEQATGIPGLKLKPGDSEAVN